MQRLADHFRAALPGGDGAGADVAAERDAGRPPLRHERFRGLPLWFHAVDAGASALRTDSGTAFDPDDAIACLQFEHYVGDGGGGAAAAGRGLRRAYYALKPLLPRRVQLELQRANARRQLRSMRFPHWPQDSTLTDLYAALLAARLAEAGLERVPFIGFWPGGATWAFCLTHDIDTATGQAASAAMAGVEEARGLRAAWFVVPERYPVDHGLVARLRDAGHEIGVHGLQHSGRLFASRAEFVARRDRINGYARAWGAVGFRSPATYRNPYWLPELDVDYDSSYMDNATFEPQRGGVCSAFPFMLSERMVELPITLPMDHTLVNVLRADVLAACSAKLDWVRAQHGLALPLFHPDYNLDAASRRRYDAVLERLQLDTSGWYALPRDVAAWWQRRRHSRIVWDGTTSPRIEGPAAADARIWWAERDGDRVRILPA
jgi:hypothetical protein